MFFYFYNFCRYSSSNCIVRNVMSNNSVCTNTYIVSDFKTPKDFNSNTKIDIVADSYRLWLFSRVLLSNNNTWPECAVASNLCRWLNENEITGMEDR